MKSEQAVLHNPCLEEEEEEDDDDDDDVGIRSEGIIWRSCLTARQYDSSQTT